MRSEKFVCYTCYLVRPCSVNIKLALVFVTTLVALPNREMNDAHCVR